MKISNQLLQKYAVPTVILPPAPEMDKEVKVEIPVTPNEPEDKWQNLLQEAEGMDPLTEKPAQTEEELLGELTQSAPPAYERELLKALRPEHGVSDESQPTIRPGKKADLSPDALVKLCTRYYDLATKL